MYRLVSIVLTWKVVKPVKCFALKNSSLFTHFIHHLLCCFFIFIVVLASTASLEIVTISIIILFTTLSLFISKEHIRRNSPRPRQLLISLLYFFTFFLLLSKYILTWYSLFISHLSQSLPRIFLFIVADVGIKTHSLRCCWMIILFWS